MNTIKIFIALFLLYFFSCPAQEKTNLDVFNELIDSSVINLSSLIPDTVKTLNLEMNTGSPFEVFNSEIISGLTKKGYNITSDRGIKIQYFIKEADVDYGEVYRSGILGDYYAPRMIHLSGNFNLLGNNVITKDFNYTAKDTIDVDSVKRIENSAYPFTQGSLPSEPFFSGIIEPVVAVGTAALAVILFFTIRSK